MFLSLLLFFFALVYFLAYTWLRQESNAIIK